MNSDINIQLVLFELIAEKAGDAQELSKTLKELLILEDRPLRNRMAGTTYLTGPEFYKLTNYYQISLEDINTRLGIDNKTIPVQIMEQVDGLYIPLFEPDLTGLKLYLERLDMDIDMLKDQKDTAWIRIICSEVPLYHLMGFTELVYFKIYVYYYHIVDRRSTFEDFLERVRSLNLLPYFEAIFESYRSIDSAEIWDKHTFEKLLRLIEECHVQHKFVHEDTLALLLGQVDQLIQYLKPLILEGNKIKYARFELYDFESVIREGFILMGRDQQPTAALLKIFMIQSIKIEYPRMLSLLHDVFEAHLGRSNAMDRSSFRAKNEFFNLLLEQAMLYRNRMLKSPD